MLVLEGYAFSDVATALNGLAVRWSIKARIDAATAS